MALRDSIVLPGASANLVRNYADTVAYYSAAIDTSLYAAVLVYYTVADVVSGGTGAITLEYSPDKLSWHTPAGASYFPSINANGDFVEKLSYIEPVGKYCRVKVQKTGGTSFRLAKVLIELKS